MTLRVQSLPVVTPLMPLARLVLPCPGRGRHSPVDFAPAAAHRVEAEWTATRISHLRELTVPRARPRTTTNVSVISAARPCVKKDTDSESSPDSCSLH